MKKALAIILAVALLCIMAVGTTLSYFTDTDGDVNSMTVGKVGITQTINNQITGIAGAKLLPAVENGTTIHNAVDMDVVVTLDSNSEEAYVRTVYAFEMMKVGDNWVDPLKYVEKDGVKVATIYYVGQELTSANVTITKDSTTYAIYYSDTAKLDENNKTLETLDQIYLGSHVGNEFYDAIGADGEYKVLVLSQAVQVQGFTAAGEKTAAQVALDTAFGAVDATNATKWFDEMPTP